MSSEWPEVALEDVVGTVNTGLDAIKRAPIIEQETGIKCLRIQDISQSKKFSAWGNTEVREQDFEKYRLRKNEIIMARTCSPGICLLVKSDMNAVFNNGLARVRALEDKISPVFLLYIFKSKEFADYIYGISHGTSVQLNMKVGDLTRYRLRLPPLSVQNGIASILSLMDDRIALLRETNATLEAIAQALFKSWFVDFEPVHAKARGEPPQGMDDATAALFPDSFEESELGRIPKGWRVLPLTDAYDINPTRKLKKGTVAPYLDMASVATSGHTVSGVTDRELGSGTKFINGDTLLARITPCLENGKTAFVDFLDDEKVAWGSTEFVVLRPKAPLPTYHGYLLSRHPAFREYAIQSMSGTSGRQRVQNDVLGRYPVIIPTPNVANTFGGMATGIQQKIAANHQQAQTLAQLRDTLLPKLISGQLRLPEAEALLAEELP